MIECFVNRSTKELLAAIEFEQDMECRGSVWNDDYDVIKFKDKVELEDLTEKKDGKTYLMFEYV